jgi:DNA-binding XRE family transcriptional regulator
MIQQSENRRRSVRHFCRLKEWRLRAELTQRELAEKADVSPNTVDNAERGLNLSLSNARAIAAVFGKSVDELWPIQNRSQP